MGNEQSGVRRREVLRGVALGAAALGSGACGSLRAGGEAPAEIPPAEPAAAPPAQPRPAAAALETPLEAPAEHLAELPAEPTAAASDPDANFAAPDLGDGSVLRFVAGVRPGRRGGYRIEAEEAYGKLLVHDYGHGGAGITLSLGGAQEVLDLVRARQAPPRDVAVIGAGISGLACAHALLTAGYGVRVLARERLERTTSWVAGGQFAPSLVSIPRGDSGSGRFERILRRSFAGFTRWEGEEWGIFRRPNFATSLTQGLGRLPADLAPRQELERLPFAGPEHRGLVVQTLMIEPPAFLTRLQQELIARGVAFSERTFGSIEELFDLPEPIVIHATGLGAGHLVEDPAVVPLAGQLVHLAPGDHPWLLSNSGYMFPRRDAVVLGGSVESGSNSTVPDEPRCRSILARHRRFFGV